MEFWNDISQKISKVANSTVKGAEKLTDITRLKYNISVEKGKLKDTFCEIGKLHYNEMIKGVNNGEKVRDKCLEADCIKAEIRNLEEKLAELSNFKICPNCKAKIEKEMLYCPDCGTKQ